jgi:uncharacterized protein YutE (UPF0331/DUF86 family)
MDNLKKQIAAEEENINIALDNLKKVMKVKRRTVIELVAMGAFLSNIYNGIENILKQILIAKGKRISNTSNWHKNLIKFSVEFGIISEELSAKLYDYLGFRHFFIHGYSFNLNWGRMKSLVKDINELWLELKNCISEFTEKI